MAVSALIVFALMGCVVAMPWSDVETVKKFDSRKTDTVKYRDCHHLQQAGYTYPGTFEIWINGEYPIKVYCNNSLTDSSTVIQRREYGDFSFQQTYQSYVNGFGNMPPSRGDFWLGLNSINYLTTAAGNNKLLVVIQDWNNVVSQATFQSFRVSGANDQYRMYVGPKVTGDLADDLYFNNGMPFATQDRPDTNNCAIHQQAGWWFNYCTYALPNGNYYFGGPYQPVAGYYNGIYWKDWKGYAYSAKFISMSVAH